jgi:WD40 repeat protein
MANLYDITSREYFGNHATIERGIKSELLDRCNMTLLQEVPLRHRTINSLDVDVCQEYLLSGGTDGSVTLYRIEDHVDGRLTPLVDKTTLASEFISRISWFPLDQEMFAVATNRTISFIDTQTLDVAESFRNFHDRMIFDVDWNRTNPNLLAVACSSSTVRFIDLRTGSSLSSLTISSQMNLKNHAASRVLWDKRDEECLFVGDNFGYIHVFDIRNMRKSLQAFVPDEHVAEPVLGMSFSPDGMKLLTCHGSQNHISSWVAKNGSFVSTNIHFDRPFTKKTDSSRVALSALNRGQFCVTDNFVGTPIPVGRQDCCVNDSSSGRMITLLSPPKSTVKENTSSRRINCVAGLSGSCNPVFFVGGKLTLRVYGIDCAKNPDTLIKNGHVFKKRIEEPGQVVPLNTNEASAPRRSPWFLSSSYTLLEFSADREKGLRRK